LLLEVEKPPVNSNELRSAFLNFFAERGHKIWSSSPLIPHGDPTLLLTNAGMVQFKPYFLREIIADNPRAATCQKCFRTSDIESVGDPNHCTFFEMLGNFSFGEYFKKEAIAWAWEFVTKTLSLPKDKLWITIYQDDDEAFEYWRKLAVPEDRIIRLGEDTNFWGPAGDSGPCGPCSEIHYDYGKGTTECHQAQCLPGCECGRFSEIWNLVFNQYNQDKDGKRTLLAKPGIDTGSGLERVLCVLQEKRTVYETDLFIPLLEKISALSGQRYGRSGEIDTAMRIVAEHSRGIPFLIADGVLPSNDGRGYVLRRLLRRAAIHGRKLGMEKPFLTETAALTIQNMGHIYPELLQRRDFILKVISVEESKFSETIITGLELVDDILAKPDVKSTKLISGTDAFRLYDTYGFPPELTSEIAKVQNVRVDLDGFQQEMAKQRERARASQRFALAEKGMNLSAVLGTAKTSFTGYQHTLEKVKVLGIINGDEVTSTISEGQEASIILDRTPFYGEMGGQVGDTGKISSGQGTFEVTGAIRLPPDIIAHKGRMIAGTISTGDEIEAEVDRERRNDIQRNHTATHLLQAALRKVLGDHIQQRGSMVAPERLRFDFSHLVAMTREEIQETNRLVNEIVRQNLAVYDEEMAYKQAIAAGTTAIFDEKYGDVVRVLRVGNPPVSAELCGGTHVKATGEIAFFHIVSESSVGASLRRIEAVTGRGAEKYFDNRLTELNRIAVFLDTEPDRLLEKAENVAQEIKNQQKRILSLERDLSLKTGQALLDGKQVIKDINVVAGKMPSARIEVMRETADWLRDQLKSGIIVLGTVYEEKPLFLAVVTPDLVAKKYNAGDIVRQVAKVTGGGGGGKPNMAQAGGKDKDKIDEALRLVKELIK
jgi:alanyl-tRNA synthetase